jgi:hypothetical protein
VQEVAVIIPYLLSIYFDVMIAHAHDNHLAELVPVIFQQIDQVSLFGLGMTYSCSRWSHSREK